MSAHRRSIMHSPLWVLLLALMSSPGVAGAQAVYEYSDDDGVPLAESDCYDSSPFEDTHPAVTLDGYLIYEESPCGSQQLGFYQGFEVDSHAYLTYRFPISGENLEVTSGTLAFTLCQVPIIYRIGERDTIRVRFNNGKQETIAGIKLDGPLSRLLFLRTGEIHAIECCLKALGERES